jgi:hypothetical protein
MKFWKGAGMGASEVPVTQNEAVPNEWKDSWWLKTVSNLD